jgi:hypothetical protein
MDRAQKGTFQKAGFPLAEPVEEFGRKKWHIKAGE